MSAFEYVGVLALLTVLFFSLLVARRCTPVFTIVSTVAFFNAGIFWIVRTTWLV